MLLPPLQRLAVSSSFFLLRNTNTIRRCTVRSFSLISKGSSSWSETHPLVTHPGRALSMTTAVDDDSNDLPKFVTLSEPAPGSRKLNVLVSSLRF